MNELETCKRFFDACETGKGWDVCQQYCLYNSSFEAQCGPLAEIKTVEDYDNWYEEHRDDEDEDAEEKEPMMDEAKMDDDMAAAE